MKKRILAVFYACFAIHISLPEEFIYPVAQIDDKNVFVVHQKSVDDLSIFSWNIESKIATKELSSMFVPSHIKILPSNTGFSFIDRGRIRIKMFQKRAPKTIEISEPIDSIAAMHWISDNQFYMVGKYRQRYKAFLCELLDHSYQIYYLTNFDSIDYIYPSKVEDSLFCLSKNNKQDYFLTEQLWNPTKYATHRPDQPQDIILSSKEPLCFLHMKNKQEGYFLRCNPNSQELLSFTCCSIIKKNSTWTETKLFTFNLPMKYLMGDSDQRVYESIYPFLPNYAHEHYIYFVDYNETLKSSSIYSYDTLTNLAVEVNELNSIFSKTTRSLVTSSKGSFAPIVLKNLLCHGLILSSQKNIRLILNTDQETGVFNLNLPTVFLMKKDIFMAGDHDF